MKPWKSLAASAALVAVAGSTLAAPSFFEPPAQPQPPAAAPTTPTAADSAAQPQAPTDEQVQQAIMAFRNSATAAQAAGTLTQEKLGQLADEQLSKLNVKQLSFDQIMMLAQGYVLAYAPNKDAVIARLHELASQPTLEGAKAAAVCIQLVNPSEAPVEDQKAAVLAFLEHPNRDEALKQGIGWDSLANVAEFNEDVVSQLIPRLASLTSVLPEDMNVQQAFPVIGFYTGLLKAAPDQQKQIEPLRAKLVAVLEHAKAALPPADENADDPQAADSARMAKAIDGQLDMLQGAYAKGQLIDHQAPQLAFNWSSGDQKITNLADLKGKVVVLDFWATWCGPCVASFPHVADLVKHYEGYPVQVLGVTSIQGAHYPGNGQQPIETEGDPDKEHSLMNDFMKDHNMTWPVAFSEQPVFNPDFGVMGIPHMAIIDPAGKVRFNGLHPMIPMEEKTAKINALLKEAGLPVPPPAAADNSDKDSDGNKNPGNGG